MHRAALLLLPLALSSCGGKSLGHLIAGNHPVCETRRIGWAVGRPPTRGRAKAMMRASRAHDLRYVRPGTMVSQEFRPDRLTVTLGPDGRIAAVRCG